MSEHDPEKISEAINKINRQASAVCEQLDVCPECVSVNLIRVLMNHLMITLDEEQLDVFVDMIFDTLGGGDIQEEEPDEDEMEMLLAIVKGETLH
tara:strand:- start:1235 stop:1519 length:285 start_codon:yes stop_codon:yes gene_type:complete